MYLTVQMLSNYLKLYDIWTLFENAYYKAKEPAQPAEMPYSAYIGRYTHSGAAQKKGLCTELTEPSSQVPPLASHASQLHPRTKLSPAQYQFLSISTPVLPGYICGYSIFAQCFYFDFILD